MAKVEKVVNATETVTVDKSLPAERISNEDSYLLEIQKLNRKVALAEAQKVLAENNLAEQTFRNFVLQLYMKYKLTETDTIEDNGTIVRNAGK